MVPLAPLEGAGVMDLASRVPHLLASWLGELGCSQLARATSAVQGKTTKEVETLLEDASPMATILARWSA